MNAAAAADGEREVYTCVTSRTVPIRRRRGVAVAARSARADASALAPVVYRTVLPAIVTVIIHTAAVVVYNASAWPIAIRECPLPRVSRNRVGNGLTLALTDGNGAVSGAALAVTCAGDRTPHTRN